MVRKDLVQLGEDQVAGALRQPKPVSTGG